jgi:hypothetical protein
MLNTKTISSTKKQSTNSDMRNTICPKLGITRVAHVAEEPMWKKELRKVTPCPQRQDSLNDQLRDLIVIANKFGFYDASYHLQNKLESKAIKKTTKNNMIEYKGYIIAESNERGGKAGRGFNKTKTLQVRQELGKGNGYLIKKQVTFTIGDAESYNRAEDKCRKYIDEHL